MNKNIHLVPVNIVDIVDRINDKNTKENEKMNLIIRLETIRDYCNTALNKQSAKIPARRV